MCPYCSSACILFGKSATGNQRYRCKNCKRTHSKEYSYNACRHYTGTRVVQLTLEGLGVRSIGRVLRISCATVLRKLISKAGKVKKPLLLPGQEYELDELCTCLKKKTNQIWVVYAINKDTKEVIDCAVGRRSHKTLRNVTDTLILSNARMVYTDKLSLYNSLLPAEIHSTKRFGTNHIERKNLTLRTHLKRLCRRTLCYSKSIAVLTSCLKLYFWKTADFDSSEFGLE